MTTRHLKRVVLMTGLGVLLMLWLPLHQFTDSFNLTIARLALLIGVCVFWHDCVDVLISRGLVHSFHRKTARDFRWRFIALVLFVECLVIKELPSRLFEVSSV